MKTGRLQYAQVQRGGLRELPRRRKGFLRAHAGGATGFALAIAAFWIAAGSKAVAQEIDCEAVRCAVQQAIDQNCRCDEAANHGRYVSCVARLVNRMARAGEIPRQCKGKIRRCAARSTCGKPGRVTCIRPAAACDPATSTCADDPATACSTDFDCGTRCSIKASAEHCAAIGGRVGPSATCCSSCPSSP